MNETTTPEKARPPIEGMTTMPEGCSQGDPIMCGAWAAFLFSSANQKAVRDEFKADTGHDLSSLIGRSPIEKMIDQATNREREIVVAFADWVTRNLWGEEEPQ